MHSLHSSARALPFRHPRSNDPADQTPPCDTLFIANPPLDNALDPFYKELQSLRGYQRAKAWSAVSYGIIHYLVQFDDEDCALIAINRLYGKVFDGTKCGPLRCAFAKHRFNETSNSLPAEEPASREPDLTDPANWISDFKHTPCFANHPPQKPAPYPTRCVRLRFYQQTPSAEREIQALAAKHFPSSKIRFPVTLQPGSHSVCYFYCASEQDAVDVQAFFHEYRLSSTLAPIHANFATPRDEPPSQTMPLGTEDQKYPPNNVLYVHFAPNGPSQQMDIKQLLESQVGFTGLSFGRPWTYDENSSGYCFAIFDSVDSASTVLNDLHGQRATPRCRPLRVCYSHHDSKTVQKFLDGEMTLEEADDEDVESNYPSTSSELEDATMLSVSDWHEPLSDHDSSDQTSSAHGSIATSTGLHQLDNCADTPSTSAQEIPASLWISHLSPKASRADVNKLFWDQPGVTDVRYVWREKPKPHPICFVDFENRTYASAAQNRLTGHVLKGEALKPRFNNKPLLRCPMLDRQPIRAGRPATGFSRRSTAFYVVAYNIPRRMTQYQLELAARKLDGCGGVLMMGESLSRCAIFQCDTEANAEATMNKLTGARFDHAGIMTGLQFRLATDEEIDAYELGASPARGDDVDDSLGVEADIGTSSERYTYSQGDSMAYAQPGGWESEDKFSDYHSDVSENSQDDAKPSVSHDLSATYSSHSDEDFDRVTVHRVEDASSPPALSGSSMPTESCAGCIKEPDCPEGSTSTLIARQCREVQEAEPDRMQSRLLLSLFSGKASSTASSTDAPPSQMSPVQELKPRTIAPSTCPTSHLEDLKGLMDYYAPDPDACCPPGSPQPIQPHQAHPSKTTIMGLPREIREVIYGMVFNSTLVLVTEMQAWRKFTLQHFPASASNADTARGISPNIFPCLERQDATPIDRLEFGRSPDLASMVFGQKLTIHNVPFKRKHSTKGISSRATNSSLLLVNKTLSSEFRASMQHRLMLAFSNRHTLVRSLHLHLTNKEKHRAMKKEMSTRIPRGPGSTDISDMLGRSRKQYLRSICLEIKTYGEPCDAALRVMRFRYYEKWRQTCAALVEQLPELSHVAVSVHVPKSVELHPSQLNLDALWVQPLLEFGKSRRLQTASVTLVIAYHTRGATLDTGEAFSEVLRRKMLGQCNMEALEALAEHKKKEQKSPAKLEVQHSAWTLVEQSNGLSPTGLLGEEASSVQ